MSADLAIINANVKTMNTSKPTAQAIAIKNGKITRVGTNQDVYQLVERKTMVLDLENKTVLPGLIDTHIHVADFGRCLIWLDLTRAHSIFELQQLLKQKTEKSQAGKWVIGQGWNENRLKKAPTVADLDKAAPDNPVILYREASMICVVNTKALKLAGITGQTEAPIGGSIDKNSQTGQLTGLFHNNATNLIWKAVPEPTVDDLLDATELALQKIVAAGLTSIHWLVLSEVELEIIQKLHIQGKIPIRVNVIVPERLTEKGQKLKTLDPLMLRFDGVTINVDGYLDSKEAALNEPYSDDPNNCGKLLINDEVLTASIQKVLAAGVRPVILAMGDKAIEITLNVIERIPKNKTRLRIEQAAILNENLLNRLKKTEIIISVQPKMISTEFNVWSAKERLGLERARWLHPLKTLIDAGVKIAGGSDCPMEPLNPFLGMQEAVFRQAYPEQRLTIDEALRMYTLNAAYSSCEEKLKGSIEEGKLADLIVVSCDPSTLEHNKIKDLTVELVVVGGEVLKT